MSEFLNEFFRTPKKTKKNQDNKYAIKHDRWDLDDYRRIHSEVKDFSVAEKDLTKIAGAPGSAAMADEFFSLVKAIPQLQDPKTLRPSHVINHMLQREQMKLPQYHTLRAHSVGDPIGTALSTVSMEPHLEVIYDKLKGQQEEAQRLEEMMQEYAEQEDDKHDLDEMISDALASGNQEQAQNFQDQKNLIEEAQERLREQIEQGYQDLQQDVESQAQGIRSAMGRALNEAVEDAERNDALNTAWGLDPGTLQRMPAEKRVEFQKLAELIGPMMRLAWAEQARKVNNVPEEIYDVELGNDLAHMLPMEYLYLNNPVLRMDWLRRYADHSLQQYKLRGNEKVAKGGIIFCEDGSGSMGGEPEVWAKAVGLALLHIAKSQNRPFTGIHFGSPNEAETFDFNTETKDKSFHMTESGTYLNSPQEFEGVEAVLRFAEIFFGGGTDFVTPLSISLDRLREQFSKDGAVKGDIVFVTDGACGVPDAWLQEFKEEQARLGFRVFGIVIGNHTRTEPLNTICDGKVLTVSDLMSGNDISQIFTEI
jgi:uncharacterized protein with von Willebrand factor type A (vWA) domain